MQDTLPSSQPKRHRWAWRIAGITLALAIVCALVVWFLPRRIWTDGQATVLAGDDPHLRDVAWMAATPVGPEFSADDDQVYEPSLSPDGTEFYFVRGKAGCTPATAHIYVSYRRNNAWSKPAPLDAANSECDDLGPRVSADGKFLLFYSNRPGGFGGYDIWGSARTGDGWGEPFNLGSQVNSEFNEYYPNPTPDGAHLVFSTNRTAAARQQAQEWNATIRQNSSGNYDLWIADLDKNTAGPATAPATQPVGEARLAFHNAREIPGINSPYAQGASCMSPAGDFLYFASDRPGGYGKFDIYRSRVQYRGTVWRFASPENLGPQVNTADNELDPFLSAGGFRLLFSTDHFGGKAHYALAASESRELFAQRLGRPLPHLGTNGYLMVLSLALLLPLFFFLRGGRHLNLLQKCIIVSLLLHAALTFMLTFIAVTQQVTKYVKAQASQDLKVALAAPRDVDLALAIRQQFNADLPLPAMPPPPLEQTPVELKPVAAEPLQTKVSVPPAQEVAASTPLAVPHHVAPPTPPAAPPARELDHLQPTVHLPEPKTPHPSEPPPAPRVDVIGPALARVLPRDDSAEERPQAIELRPAPAQASAEPADITPVPSPTISPQPIAAAMASLPTGVTAEPKLTTPPAAHQIAAAETAPKADDLTAAARQQVNTPTPHPAINSPAVAPLTHAGTDPSPSLPMLSHVAAAPPLPVHPVIVPGIPPANEQMQPTVAATGQRQSAPDSAISAIAEASLARAAPNQIHGGLAGGTPLAIHVDAPQTAASPAILGPASIGLPSHSDHLANVLRAAASPTTAPVGLPQADAAVAITLPRSGVAAVQHVEAPLDARAIDTIAQSTRISYGWAASGPVAFSGPATAGPTTAPGLADGAIAAAHIARPVEFTATHIGELPNNGGDNAIAPNVVLPAGAGPVAVADPTSDHAQATEVALNPSTQAPAGAIMAPGPSVHIAAATPAVAPNTAMISDAAATSPGVAVAATHVPAAVRGDPGGTGNLIADGLVPSVGKLDAGLPSHLARAPVAGKGSGTLSTSIGEASNAIGRRLVLGADLDRPVDLVSAAAPAAAVTGAPSGLGDGVGVSPSPVNGKATSAIEVAAVPFEPSLTTSPIPGALGPGRFTAPDSPFMRAPEQRKPLIAKLGGTEESETTVAGGLAYLARVQNADGHWAVFNDDPREAQLHTVHDSACTGMATLAFLAQDHSPAKPGPYREVVAKALDYLVADQAANGDLRGSHAQVKSGANGANMYDHAIATLALAEAAIMTRDERYTQAAKSAAQFIIAAQDLKSGGWRYSPGESGDTSVFGWQILALHSAEQIGFEIPQHTRDAAKRYIERASVGKLKMLGCYKPGDGTPTAVMTAELLFARILLGEKLSDEQAREATDFLTAHDPGEHNLYYFYYASLCMVQLQDPAWKQWNSRTRDLLVHSQAKDAMRTGSWDTTFRYAEKGGRVFTTSMATLTLEVYYRYLPMTGKKEN